MSGNHLNRVWSGAYSAVSPSLRDSIAFLSLGLGLALNLNVNPCYRLK